MHKPKRKVIVKRPNNPGDIWQHITAGTCAAASAPLVFYLTYILPVEHSKFGLFWGWYGLPVAVLSMCIVVPIVWLLVFYLIYPMACFLHFLIRGIGSAIIRLFR